MKIKKGDKIKVLAGKDRGKTGKVLEVRPENERVVIEGVNLVWKHMRPRRGGEKGQKIQKPASLHLSSVALVCNKCGQATRVGFKVVENKKTRLCQKCKEVID